MMHPVVITFAFDSDDETAKSVVEMAVELFDQIAGRDGGIHMRIPIRIRSEPLTPQGNLRPLHPSASKLDVLVFLQSQLTARNAEAWETFHDDARAAFQEAQQLLFLAAPLDQVAPPAAFRKQQSIRWCDWSDLDDKQSQVRLMIRLVNAIRQNLGKLSMQEHDKIFVSHAKRDGKKLAEKIIRHIQDPDNGLGLDSFYDALQLESGERFDEGLEEGVRTSLLLALVTNAYETRPWCNQELLWAKRMRKPVLLLETGRKRVDRTFPYLGNLPLRRYNLSQKDGIERALLDLLAEALRCDLFHIAAADLCGDSIHLPRAPELLDLGTIKKDAGSRIIYPDPPLPSVELEILQDAAPDLTFLSLGEAAP